MGIIKTIQADKLKVNIYDTRKALGEEAAKEFTARVKQLLQTKSEINIVFAAAPSQNEFIHVLANNKEIEWGRINACHMDEYMGLDPEAPQGFGNFLRDRLFEKQQFKSVNYLKGDVSNIDEECKRYAGLLKQFPTDIVCMGIGENGHIAFNDPHVAFFDDPELVKVVELDEKCRRQQVNDGCFKSLEKVPTHALTLTIPALAAADCIFCMVPGSTKAQAVFDTVTGDISEKCPASILKIHNNATLYTDMDSAAKII